MLNIISQLLSAISEYSRKADKVFSVQQDFYFCKNCLEIFFFYNTSRKRAHVTKGFNGLFFVIHRSELLFSLKDGNICANNTCICLENMNPPPPPPPQ